MIVNKYNFLRWDDLAPSTEQPAMPTPYRRDRGGCPYMPIGYPTESLSFYINTVNGFDSSSFSGTAFSGLRLDLIDARTNLPVATGIGVLQQHFLDAPTNSKYNIYSTVVLPAAATGVYYFRIVRVAAGVPALQSNFVLVRNDKANLDLETAYVRFRHDRFFYNVGYQDLPGFYQQFRIHLNIIERQLDSDKEIYKEVTTGKHRVSENYLERYYRIETYYFDDAAHEAAGVMVEHDFLEINGRPYKVRATYKENSNQLSVYSKGEFEIWDESFASVNRC